MPVDLAHTASIDLDKCRSDVGRNRKVAVSAMRTRPPGDAIGGNSINLNTMFCGTCARASSTASCASGGGTSLRKMNSSSPGIRSKVGVGNPRFSASHRRRPRSSFDLEISSRSLEHRYWRRDLAPTTTRGTRSYAGFGRSTVRTAPISGRSLTRLLEQVPHVETSCGPPSLTIGSGTPWSCAILEPPRLPSH
ncbi:hypothetical protein ACVMB0_007341 [Bradyrhizobium sp. USDA 4451]